AIPRDGIFEIDLSNSYTNESSIYAVSYKRAKLDLDSALLWHCRLGHISKKRIKKLQHDGLLNSTDLRAFGKCVPYHVKTKSSYFVTFTDDFSRYGYVYLLKHKHEVFETFKVFKKEVENQLGKTIKSLRFDRGGEYMSQEFLDHLKDHGIIAHRTPPYTPQHNGVSKRRNKTLLDMVRSMISQTTLLKSFWDYALETAVRILNIGCEALVKQDTLTNPDKLEPRSIKCIFMGYPKETMGYSFYYPPENKVHVARNAEFLENSLITQEASGSLEDLEIIQEEDTHPSIDTSLDHEDDDLEMDEPQSDIVPIRRSTRTRHASDRMCLYIDAEEHELGDLDNEVWVLVELPPNGETVGSRWLFKKKTEMDGVVHNYKARLMAKDYTQTSGIDYKETFSPVANIRAIRIMTMRFGKWMSKLPSLMDISMKRFTWSNLKVKLHILLESRSTEIDHGGASTPDEVKQMQNVLYASAVGFIMYAVRCSRHDVAFAQNTVYVFVLNGGAVDWKSAKQSIFATSSAEAEYIAAFDASNEAVWVRKFISRLGVVPTIEEPIKAEYIAAFDTSKEAVWVRKFISRLGVVPTIEEPISMYCDNIGAIAIANESGITKVFTDDICYWLIKIVLANDLYGPHEFKGQKLASVVTVLENFKGLKAISKSNKLLNAKKKVEVAIAFAMYVVLSALIIAWELFVEYGDEIFSIPKNPRFFMSSSVRTMVFVWFLVDIIEGENR
nr:hypothetical protein [Tanacetum cinerariifolium]